MSLRATLALLLAVAPPALAQAPAAPAPAAGPVLDVRWIDRSADPCLDLYAFACGRWSAQNPIPPDQASWEVFSKLQEENNAVLRTLLESSSRPGPGRDAVQAKIGDYYAACMDEAGVERQGAAPLREDLARIAGLGDRAGIADWLAAFHPTDTGSTLFSFGWTPDYRDARRAVAEADQGGLGLPDRELYLAEDDKSKALRQAYHDHVRALLALAGDSPERSAAAADAVLRIETALARASMPRVERRDPRNRDHFLTRAAFAALSPGFAWDRYLAAIGQGDLASLNVASPGFFQGLGQVLGAEGLPAWKDYLRWHLVHARAAYLSAAFVAEDFAFYGKALTGAEAPPPRWKRCVELVDRDLPEALGQVYVKEHFPPEARARTEAMVKDIQAAMEERLGGLSWMSPATRAQALVKLHGMRNKVGFPSRWRDYGPVAVGREDLAGNVSRARVFEWNRQLAKIGRPVDRDEWQMSPPTVNAYYNPQTNDINFPAGVLQPPLFDPRGDDAPNYGDTGGTVGHELVHGFDDSGRKFDADGNLRDWWTPEDARGFETRAQCVVDQYSGYTVLDGIHINGRLTAGEDIADLGGLQLAWMAWRRADAGRPSAALDGFTPEQRFFVGYAQSWCSEVRPETQRLLATIDPHSPPRFRANGVVVNMPEFAQAFACKPGQPMVRENPCAVW